MQLHIIFHVVLPGYHIKILVRFHSLVQRQIEHTVMKVITLGGTLLDHDGRDW
jgi:hypothetical protein